VVDDADGDVAGDDVAIAVDPRPQARVVACNTRLRALLDHDRGGPVPVDPAPLELLVSATRAEAERILEAGDAMAAAELAGEAIALAERIPAPFDAAEARLLAGRAHAAAGAVEQAKAALQQVAADAARGGAVRLRDAAARELRALGTRIAPRNRHAAGGDLTERERTVAELVAQGRTNKQVAAQLFLTEGTIENTLTRVYAKLGVRSRTQLTRVLVGVAP
jgi:DNA-binding NarL/FixJ family response regulator